MPNENGDDSFYCLTNRFDPQLYIHKDKLHRLQCRFLGRLHHCLHRHREWPNRIYRNQMNGLDSAVVLIPLHLLKTAVRERTLRRAIGNKKWVPHSVRKRKDSCKLVVCFHWRDKDSPSTLVDWLCILRFWFLCCLHGHWRPESRIFVSRILVVNPSNK